jgi:hypothetical protein
MVVFQSWVSCRPSLDSLDVSNASGCAPPTVATRSCPALIRSLTSTYQYPQQHCHQPTGSLYVGSKLFAQVWEIIAKTLLTENESLCEAN